MKKLLRLSTIALLLTNLFSCSGDKQDKSVQVPGKQTVDPKAKIVDSELKSEGRRISRSVTDIDGNQVDLKEFCKSGNKVVFRFTEMDCRPCIDAEISKIKDLSDEIGAKNIIIIADYENPRGLKVFVKENNISNVVFNCENLGIDIDDKDISPYVFTVKKDLKATNIHAIDRLNPQKTMDYYNKITKELF